MGHPVSIFRRNDFAKNMDFSRMVLALGACLKTALCQTTLVNINFSDIIQFWVCSANNIPFIGDECFSWLLYKWHNTSGLTLSYFRMVVAIFTYSDSVEPLLKELVGANSFWERWVYHFVKNKQ